MKSMVSKMMMVLMVGALTSVAAFAKVHKEKVTFDSDIKVNGTVVKKGIYDVKFDDESGKLAITKNGKVVAEATAKLEQREKKANDFQLRATTSGDETQLVGFTFSGSDKNVVITSGGSTSTGTAN